MTRSIFTHVAKIAILSLVALPARAHATPFDAGRVPAEAEGVGHLDMDALRKTVLHRMLRPKLTSGSHWEEVDASLRPILRTLLDVAQGVSFWLTDRDTGAVLIQVPDPQKIQVLLDKIPHEGELRVAGHMARRYDFSTASGHDDDPSLAAMVGKLLILADDEPSLAKAIGAASGKGKSLSAARRVPEGSTDRGLFFFSSLNHKLLDEVKDAAESRTLRIDMSSLIVRVTEVRSELRVRVKMNLSSAEEAQKLRSMVEGVIALASMSDDAAEFRPLLKGVRVSATGKAAEISLSLPSAELVHIIESND